MPSLESRCYRHVCAQYIISGDTIIIGMKNCFFFDVVIYVFYISFLIRLHMHAEMYNIRVHVYDNT